MMGASTGGNMRPTEDLYEECRNLFFNNIDSSFLSAEIVDWCDDQLNEWLDVYYSEDEFPSRRLIVEFAWKINLELAEMEMDALLKDDEVSEENRG